MDKRIRDRLNHLKSELQHLSKPKMDKYLSLDRIAELKIRINELQLLIK